MGRGLSDLQRWIVDQTQERKDLPPPNDRLYYSEIYERYFRWEREAGSFSHPGSRKFSPDQTGRAEYNRVTATVSRSCARLRDRGLVECLHGRAARWSAVRAVARAG